MTDRIPRTRGIAVEVTPEIIARAVQRNSGHCVIADALKAAVPSATKVSVDLQTIRFSLPSTGKRYVYLTPAPAQHALVDFDQGEAPEPQVIRLGRPIHVAPIRRDVPREQPAEPRRVVIETDGHGHEYAVTVGGDITTPTGALADPPVRSNHRYAGQRRQFGLRMLRK